MFEQFSRKLAFRYEAIKMVHGGSSGLVYEAKRKEDGETVAVKILHKKASYENFLEEIRILNQLYHPNIITLHESESKDPHKTFPFYVVDYYPNQSLADQDLVNMPVAQKLDVLIDIANGLHYIHCRGYNHRSIHPSNVFVTEERRAVIGDFRVAGKERTLSNVVLGCPHYIAPEYFLRESKLYYSQGDIYSFGVCVFQMFSEKTLSTELFYDYKKHERILRKDLNKLPEELSQPIFEMYKTTTARDLQERYSSMEEVLAILNDIKKTMVGESEEENKKQEVENLIPQEEIASSNKTEENLDLATNQEETNSSEATKDSSTDNKEDLITEETSVTDESSEEVATHENLVANEQTEEVDDNDESLANAPNKEESGTISG